MTEAEWLACKDPRLMLEFLRGKVTDRKLRLWAIGAIRNTYRTVGRRSEQLCAVAEADTDGTTPLSSLRSHWGGSDPADPSWPERPIEWVLGMARTRSKHQMERRADLARCIFGGVFRLGTPGLACLTPTAVKLAQAGYTERLPNGNLDPQRLAILADALEDAGCIEQSFLDHCRGPGPHVRGCWVVDLILGKQ
jgi:hypothetical protein